MYGLRQEAELLNHTCVSFLHLSEHLEGVRLAVFCLSQQNEVKFAVKLKQYIGSSFSLVLVYVFERITRHKNTYIIRRVKRSVWWCLF